MSDEYGRSKSMDRRLEAMGKPRPASPRPTFYALLERIPHSAKFPLDHDPKDCLRCAFEDWEKRWLPMAESVDGVPGMWKCPTCGYILTKNYISPDLMRVGVNRADECELCPNDGARLIPLSWKEACENQEKYIADLHAKLDAERERCAALCEKQGCTCPSTAETPLMHLDQKRQPHKSTCPLGLAAEIRGGK